MKNKIEDLRNHLFATLEALQDEKKPMDIDRAKTVAEVAGQIIASAKVEVDMLRIVGGAGTGFIPNDGRKPALPSADDNATNVKRIKAS
jgi:hypothetical protein